MAGDGDVNGPARRNPPCFDDGIVIYDKAVNVSNGKTEAMKKLDGNIPCIASSNVDLVLASAFCVNCALSGNSLQPVTDIDICEDAIGALATIFPINVESQGLLASFVALCRMAWILCHGSPEGRRNAVLVLQELASRSDGKHMERIGAVDGLAEGLVEVVKEGISAAATKAGLTVIYHIAGRRRIRVEVVQAGAIPVLLELLPEADTSTCERAMACLHVLCNSSEGRSAAETHALTVPLLVKILLRVSQLTTEFAVCVLWTICRNSSNESLLVDAVQVRTFDKLVMVLQIGCSAKAR